MSLSTRCPCCRRNPGEVVYGGRCEDCWADRQPQATPRVVESGRNPYYERMPKLRLTGREDARNQE